MKQVHFFLLSSTLQYLENPYDYLEIISDLKPQFIFIDKNPFFLLTTRIT